MKSQFFRKLKIPDNSGVYFFKKGNEILYIGKATSLRSRVRSYFNKDLIATRGPVILDMIVQADKLDWQETDSVLEALILETNLIKKYQPKYNTKEKDNKSFNYVCITKDKLPKVLVLRERGMFREASNIKYQSVFGPFPNGLQLREALKIIRRIFPYIDSQSSKKNNIEFYKQLGLTPGSSISNLQYKNNIKNLKLFFDGKKKKILQNFKKEMMYYAKSREFEKAGEIKKRIFSLEHINDVALIKDDLTSNSHLFTSKKFRIEAYDIAHMSGKNMVGVMTVIEDNEISKSEYKKFIIKSQNNANDTGALEEILSRRFRHTEWGLPNLVVVDGGIAQINTAKQVLLRYKFDIPIVGVVKDKSHKPKAILGNNKFINKHKKEILLSNSEAHRFVITFHKNKRLKSFI